MAAGDITSVVIGADGWYADITVAGVSTGGTYAFGLGTNNDPATGTPKLALTVVSLGFDDTGATTTITRTVYGTKEVRKAYPNQATNEESTSGGNATVRVALSDYIYAKDNTGVGNSGTAVTATFLSGVYTQGGTPSNAISNTAVTNNSTVAYPKVIGNWSFPGYNKLGTTFKQHACVFHKHGQSGRPVRCVKFTATDAHSHTVTGTVTAPSVDTSIGDANPVVEYWTSLDGTTFTQNDVVTLNFVAYPWVGDTAACLDTSAGTAQPTALPGPRSGVADKGGTYATSVAVVDSVSGNDGTGTVTTDYTTALPYATIAAAANGLRTYNSSNYSRANKAGSTIYLKTGNHAWTGGTVTADGVAPDAWVTITRYPGLAVSDAVIASQSGTKIVGVRIKILGVTITAQLAAGVVTGASNLWADQCVINLPTSNQPFFYQNTVQYATRCTVTALNQGFKPFSTTNAPFAITRGNTMSLVSNSNLAYMFIGNRLPHWASGSACVMNYSGQTAPSSDGCCVIAFNTFRGAVGTTSTINSGLATSTLTVGMAVVQNLVETTTTGNPLVQIAADGTTGTPFDNVIIWHNTVVGERFSMGYNEVAFSTVYDPALRADRRWWSVKNNLTEDVNVKGDLFNQSGYSPNGGKIGNWPVLFGVGHSGNLWAEVTDGGSGIGASGSFLLEFSGLKSDMPAPTLGGSGSTGVSRTLLYPKFTDREAYANGVTGAGNGDYTLQAASPAISLPKDSLLPYDLAGNSRTADAAGAYAAPVTGSTVVDRRRLMMAAGR